MGALHDGQFIAGMLALSEFEKGPEHQRGEHREGRLRIQRGEGASGAMFRAGWLFEIPGSPQLLERFSIKFRVRSLLVA